MKQIKLLIFTILRSLGVNFYSVIDRRRIEISNMLRTLSENTILYGPLQGFYFHDTNWGRADQSSQILGLYEAEVLREILSIGKETSCLINLGAADGYYSVGLVRNRYFEKSYSFEISNRSREIISLNAIANGVVDNVAIFGEAEQDFYKLIPNRDLNNALILVDIEGAEFDVFNENTLRALKNCFLIIELHEFIPEGVLKSQKLISRASETHSVRTFAQESRNLSNISEIKNFSDNDRWLICSEGRPEAMRWLRLDPK